MHCKLTNILARPELFLASALVACGGGGSDPDPTIHVTYAPSAVTASLIAGQSQSLSISATLSSTPSGNVYSVVVADKPVIVAGSTSVVQSQSGAYLASVDTDGQLAPRTYTGTFVLHLCKDAACASEYPLTGAALPYTIRVSPRVLLRTQVAGTTYDSTQNVQIVIPSGSQATLTSNLPVTWSQGSSISGTGFQVISSTPTAITVQFGGGLNGFIGVVGVAIDAGPGNAAELLFGIAPP